MPHRFNNHLNFDNINELNDTLSNYKGIDKSQYPKWAGWKIIKKYKKVNDLTNTDKIKLSLLAEIFYYIKYLRSKF